MTNGHDEDEGGKEKSERKGDGQVNETCTPPLPVPTLANLVRSIYFHLILL